MRKLVEIAIFTPDVKRTVDFYRSFLGESPKQESAESATFMLGNTKLFVHVKDKSGESPGPDFPPAMDHVAFGVHNVDKASVELRDAGIRPAIGPRDFYWGRSAYFRDPDGRLVELHEEG